MNEISYKSVANNLILVSRINDSSDNKLKGLDGGIHLNQNTANISQSMTIVQSSVNYPSSLYSLYVLILDDSPVICKSINMILTRQSHTVEIVENGAVVVEIIKQKLSDKKTSLVNDTSLRKCSIDGYESKEEDQIVHSNLLYHHFIIGSSANSDSALKQEAYKSGIDHFIPKPLTVREFYDAYSGYVSHLNPSKSCSSVSIR
eukprot:gene12986-17413_t